MCADVLMEGSFFSVDTSVLGAANKLIESFLKTESKSMATCFTDLDGEYTRLMTGKMNKSSSFIRHEDL